jgi:hypothetical protein
MFSFFSSQKKTSAHTISQRIVAGFTLVEVAITLGALGIAAGLTVPMYRRYMVRNDVEIARQNIAQGIERAKFLSQVGMNDSEWGFSTDAIPGRGVLFMGRSFAERNSAYDELYTVSDSLSLSGLTEVTFEKITGIPTVTGDIIIRSPDNDEVSITVSLGTDGQVDIPADWLEICTNPFTADQQTIRVPDSLWLTYQGEGALMGSCTSLITSSAASSVASGGGSVSSGGGGGGGGIGSSTSSTSSVGLDPDDFDVDGDTIVPTVNYNFTATVIGTSLRIASGYLAPITVRFKKSSGPFEQPWGDFTKAVDGNINKAGTFTYTSGTISALTELDVWVRSYSKTQSWYDGTQNNHFNQKMQVRTETETTLVHALVDGDDVPTYVGAGTQPSVEDFLVDYVDPVTGKIDLAPNQVIYLFELWTTNMSSPDADFQDLVLLVTLNPAS